jgi:hypothetical protein
VITTKEIFKEIDVSEIVTVPGQGAAREGILATVSKEWMADHIATWPERRQGSVFIESTETETDVRTTHEE